MGDFTWTSNETNLCYEGPEGESFCGKRDNCTGMVLPLVFEGDWNPGFRIFIYLFGLLYSFFGISIVADVFMCAIEKITSKTKRIHVATAGGGEPDIIEVPVWNGTVANLTLMALGSSAPEILLAIVGVVGNNFEAEALGPGTIVGSAAFNLLAITAVCTLAIPAGETRRIKNFTVFCVTALFSIFAYIWLIIVLVFISEVIF